MSTSNRVCCCHRIDRDCSKCTPSTGTFEEIKMESKRLEALLDMVEYG